MALPLMLMVAPSGNTKDAVALVTFRSCSQVSMLTGRVAMEEAVEKATICGFFIAEKYLRTGVLEKTAISSG
ncbi:hypothetical protein D3C79_861980 [compost metagenome]